ncbi:MAG: methyl-accepting chemotaxis protein [Desulfomonile tiedjei]|uniref:Methyl-accepting chemotaxis protein n=1 Tax=Desulfomonile tiedjei TaxID=2358 RepID=A0A9D6V0Q0_9BACT|nr:methyl-accepting chemotaxis protein [Desulfomonile tiedjei]
MSATDYRGEATFSAYLNVHLNKVKDLNPDFKWIVVTEISAAEVLHSAESLGQRTTFITLCIAAVIGLIAFFLAKTFIGPLTVLAGQVSKASEGDLTVRLEEFNRRDEIGVLGQAVGSMLDSLRDQVRRITEVVTVLSSAAADISSTVAQLATSTSKTSAAVTETTTTVEQVKQAAKVSSEKAKKVSSSAQQAVQVSESGKKATEDTVHGMNLIKDQMESIGETVVRLSEHSQAIEDIINAVQDIADQSNLLAVNASIEAARAGDQGKGFAVVAYEIKNLADQSKKATEQVKSILNDTRKWVNAVVMAAEQGGKAVDAGVTQSLVAGEAIQSLASSVATSSQAASVIDSTSEQQFIGVDQVARAMANIEHAMRQNLDGTSQLEAAAKELEELGEFLRGLVHRYKI